jgi:hypothetical protein
MLRIEIYPVMSGLMVRAVACSHAGTPDNQRSELRSVTRTIPSDTIETVGVDEAIRDHLLDLVVLYPGLFEAAMD